MARKMKDSGIEWIGEIPEGWEITRLKYLADFEPTCDTSSLTDESKITYTPMECVKNGGFENRSALYGNLSHTLTPFQNGDIAMAKVTPCFENGNIAIMDNLFSGFGLGSSELFIFRPKSISTRYFFYWLQNKAFVARACSTMTGTGGLKRISPSFIRNCPVHCPSTDEQTKISDYLDAKCSEIDDLLTSVRSSIEEYKKLKQAVITQAVTKGVRGEREMKPTDFTRWSEIPFDWDLKRVKSCIASISSGLSAVTDDANSEESGKFVLRTSAVSSGFFVPTEVKPVLKSAVNRLICPVEPDTLIVSRMNTASMVGACAYVANNYPNTFLPDKLWKIKFLPSYHTKYMWYALNSVPAKSWFSELATGASSSMQNISINDFTSNYLPIPAFSEQKEIANYLDAKCAEIDGLVAKKEQLVKELESYKKSLIYEVVTGKREV